MRAHVHICIFSVVLEGGKGLTLSGDITASGLIGNAVARERKQIEKHQLGAVNLGGSTQP